MGLTLLVRSNSQAHYAKGMPWPLGAPTVCGHMVSGSVSLPSTGFFSPFPHGTGSLSVVDEYLALEGGPPGFGRSFTCSGLLGIPAGWLWLSGTGLSPCIAQRSSCFPWPPPIPMCESRNPRARAPWFWLIPVRSPLLGESRLISFPPGTEMFHFPGCRFPCLCIGHGIRAGESAWVAPFGDPRINARLPLTEAYRSLPRPSSPVYAKASTMCP